MLKCYTWLRLLQLFYLLYLCLILSLLGATSFAAEEQLLNLSCRDADIRDVLRGIALQHGINIIPDSNVSGNVTIHLRNVPLETGLQTLLQTNGFEYEKRDRMYLVHAKSRTAKDLEISFQDGKLTVSAEDADVRQLLRELSRQTGLNIVTETGVVGNVSAHLSNVPVDSALYALLPPNGFIVSEDDGIYSVRNARSQGRGQGSFAIFYRKGKLSVDVKNAPTTDVLSEIAEQCKINLTLVGDVRGNVTMRLDGVTLEQALDTLTSATGNAYVVKDGIYLVGDPTVKPGQVNPLLEKKIIRPKHIPVQELINYLPPDFPRTSVAVSQDRNALIVLAPKRVIERLEAFIDEMDIEDPDIRSRQQSAMFVEVDPDGLLTIDAKDAPMEALLREISIRKGVDMTILGSSGTSIPQRATRLTKAKDIEQPPQPPTASPPPSPRVSTSRTSGGLGELVNLRISRADLDSALSAIFKGTIYTFKKDVIGNREFYIIGPGELWYGGGNPLIVSKKIPLRYLNATNIMDVLPLTVPDANIVPIEDQNAIVVLGTQDMIDEVERYIAQIDSPSPQIMIEALLVEVVRGSSRDLGVTWSWEKGKSGIEVAPGLSVTFDSLINVPESFLSALEALVSENKARVLAAPRVATSNGLKAKIKVGWTDYFETTTEIYRGEDNVTGGYIPYGGYIQRGFNELESGITLEITPWVGAAGEITALIHPEVRNAELISREHSTIAERSLDTTVRVKDGEDIVIGGLIQRSESNRESKVPLLGSIPILGNLFKESTKAKNDTELIVVIRPKIVGSEAKEAENEAR